jgi:2-methylisocitrate lyase-like PEP mutase family enzyme
VWPGLPPASDLAAAGVRRISQGAASFLLALGQLEQTTRAYLDAPAPSEPALEPPVPAMHLVEPLTARHR